MTTKDSQAKELATTLLALEGNLLTVLRLLSEIKNDTPIDFVSDFKNHTTFSLVLSAAMLEDASGFISTGLRQLAAVLYVREMEMVSKVGDWRSIAYTRPVEASKILREGIEKLTLSEAKAVITAFRQSPF